MDNTFQIIIIGLFVFFALVGVGLFATGSLGGSDDELPPVSFSIWGEWSQSTFSSLLEESGIAENDSIIVSYTTIDRDNLQERLVNALARGEGPDVVLIPHTQVLQLSDLITPIGSDFYLARKFRNSFSEAGEIFTSDAGIYALPVAVDPLVMYWNRDILTNAGFVNPPATWDELPNYVERITVTDESGGIQTAGIGMGTAGNITHAEKILSSLFLQVDNSIVTTDADGNYQSVLAEGSADSVESAVRMYTQYGNPSSSTYTWSNSFTSDLEAFVAGDLAMFLAPASEITAIRNRNPNLNFDVSLIPQLTDETDQTYGTVYGFSILNRAENKALILNALDQMTGTDMAEAVSNQANLTPIHKSTLTSRAADPYKQVFFDAAVISRAWLNPDETQAENIFFELISDVITGRRGVSESVQAADVSFSNLLRSVSENQ